MLTNMENAGTLIREGRARLGLSTRDLATLAGVAYPTVSRIEHGREDPRWSTMGKLLAVLDHGTSGITLSSLADACALDRDGRVQPDFTRLRAFVDYQVRHPARLAAAILPTPSRSDIAMIDNLLAAIAEKLADDAGIRRPAWTRTVERLASPWEAPGTPRMRARNACEAPSQFAARNVMIPGSTLWRPRQVTA